MTVDGVRDALVAALGPGARAIHQVNHTGAGKLSFAVRLTHRRLWARVAADDEEDWRLTTWERVGPLLAERHHAPPVLDVLEVDGRIALLFPYLTAPVATRATLRASYPTVRAVLSSLHGDLALADLLGPPTTTAACFRSVWLDRFDADLAIVEGYLAPGEHAYLADEVAALELLVDDLDSPVDAAVHGDPGHENWLLAPGRPWLLDWETLAVGDPALDHAVLVHDALGPDLRNWPADPAYAVARRALLLDAALDTAADWVEARDPLVRGAKEAAYLAGLEAYRALTRP